MSSGEEFFFFGAKVHKNKRKEKKIGLFHFSDKIAKFQEIFFGISFAMFGLCF
jgi:hypothetical protein